MEEETIIQCECPAETECQCCKEEEEKNNFEGQFSVEMNYIFGPTKSYTGSSKTIEMKVPRKNPS